MVAITYDMCLDLFGRDIYIVPNLFLIMKQTGIFSRVPILGINTA